MGWAGLGACLPGHGEPSSRAMWIDARWGVSSTFVQFRAWLEQHLLRSA